MIENKTLNLIVELSGVAKNGNTGDAGEIASAVLGAQNWAIILRRKSCQKHLEILVVSQCSPGWIQLLNKENC